MKKPILKCENPDHAARMSRPTNFGILLLLTIAVLFSGCATTPTRPLPPLPPEYPPEQPMSEYTGACFYDFPEVYVQRIYPVLDAAPGVEELRRAQQNCGSSRSCICYDLVYSGTLERLERWIRRELPTSKAVPFRIESRGENFIEVYHTGGFD